MSPRPLLAAPKLPLTIRRNGSTQEIQMPTRCAAAGEVASHEASWRCHKPISAFRQQCRRPSRRRANCVTPQEGGKKQDLLESMTF